MNIKHIYFIGIGGIGMSAIARYYNSQEGYVVSGYDRTSTELTQNLEKEGIAIHYEARVDLIPKDKENTLVIYTPAIPSDFAELVLVQTEGYKLIKRSKALGEIASTLKTLAISGTHGKTSTSTLLAHIITNSGEGCTAFLGGISKNYHNNLLLSKSKVLVAEADEFDRSFLQLFPNIALISSIDADHLDIYHDYNHILEAFTDFGKQCKDSLIIKKGIDFPCESVNAKIYRYSFDQECDFYAKNIKTLKGGYFEFDLHTPNEEIKNCTVGIPGWINVENGVGAAAVAYLHGTPAAKIKEGLASYQGVERRFDLHINTDKVVYIDDYAHHPKEISSAISSIRNMFPDRKLTGIFQPHLFSRTNDFYKEFAESLDMLDKLILLPIYPARELPIEGVSSHLILDNMKLKDRVLVEKDQILETIKKSKPDVLITFGAGDISNYIQPIKECLEN